jgi:hypothetical protein
MEKHLLSKSTYIKGEQCLKQLFLHKKHANLRDRMPAERLAVFSRGTQVGLYAQQLFPDGIDAGPKHPSQYQKAVEKTALLVAQGQSVIYEAAFTAHKTLILLDILVKNGEYWDAYEVKSSKSLTETYYQDAALQYYVLKTAGVPLSSFSLIHINQDYERENEIDIHKLFIISDVTHEVISRFEKVKQKIAEEIAVLGMESAPIIDIGKHCFAPYDCDFIGHCWQNIPKPSVFDLPFLSLDEQLQWYHKGMSDLHLFENEAHQSALKTQINCHLKHQEYLDAESLETLKAGIDQSKPSYLFKILRFRAAIPLFPNTKPYQELIYAFAILPLSKKKGELDWFVADGQQNPDAEIQTRINQYLASVNLISYCNTDQSLANINLKEWVERGIYYHPAFKKDYSNKSLSFALGIRAPWKGIESDLVAAQYFDDILRGHKDADSKRLAIENYLKQEVQMMSKFANKLGL